MSLSDIFCTGCGAANRAQSSFCHACGQPLQTHLSTIHSLASGSTMSSSTGLLPSNHQLKQRYAILGRIGQGGMGAVYKAEDTLFHNRLVAVKEMSQSGLGAQEVSDAAEAFKSEAHMLAGLDHPSLPKIYDYFIDAGRWYLVMDFIEGETLEGYMEKKGGKLSVQETLEMSIQLCTVLIYLHNRQPAIIFRDLKPSNVMRAHNARIFLIDFGIARHFKVGQTKDTSAFGSAGYAAPEQYGKAQTGPYSDIYSLGATLHQCITGDNPAHTPFKFASLRARNQAVSADLETLVLQMVAIEAEKRPVTMAEVKKELARLANQPAQSGYALASQQTPATTTAQQWLATGNEHLNAGQHTAALHSFDQAIRLDPRLAVAYRKKGMALHLSQRFEEALSVFDQAIRLDPADAENYYYKGNAFAALQRFVEALDCLEKAVSLAPDFVNAQYNRGNCLLELERYEEAIAAYELILQLDPDYTAAEENRATALDLLRGQGPNSQGRTKAQWVNEGNEHIRAGRYDEGISFYNEAIRLDPDFALAYNNKGLVLVDFQRYTEALQAFDEAIRSEPESPDAYFNKGNVLDDLGRYAEALSAFEQAVRLDPTDARAYFNKGNMLKNLQRYEQALVAYNQAIRLDPSLAKAYISKGFVLDELRRHTEALACFEQAIRLDPTDAMAYNNKGFTLLNLKRHTEALACFEQAVRLDPDYTFAYNNKGTALLNLRRYNEALAAYEQAIRLDPTFIMAYENKSAALQQLGRGREARQVDEQVRQLRAGQRS